MARATPGNLYRLHVLLARASATWITNRRASTRPALLRAVAAQLLAALAAIVALRAATWPVLRAPGPSDLPADGTNGVRFELPEAARREIFREIASSEPNARLRAAQAFPGDLWSTEDHRASFERDLVRAIAQRRTLSLSQVYLILDEGIREHWPGSDGKPLSAQSYPLSPRKR